MHAIISPPLSINIPRPTQVVAVCDEASLFALEADLECTKVADHCFIKALDIVKPRTTPETVAFYENYYNDSRK